MRGGKYGRFIIDTRPAAQTCAMGLVLTDSRAQHADRAQQHSLFDIQIRRRALVIF